MRPLIRENPKDIIKRLDSDVLTIKDSSFATFITNKLRRAMISGDFSSEEIEAMEYLIDRAELKG